MLKKNLFYNGLLSISQFIFPLITFPYSSRILGPEGLGSVNFIDSFTQYFILFSSVGIPLYGLREISKWKNEPEQLKKVFNQMLSIHLISTAGFSIIYLLSAMLVPALRTHLDIVVIGILIMLSNLFLFEWFFQGIGEFSYLAIRSVIVRVLTVIFLFTFLKTGSDPLIYYAIAASGYVINAALNIYFIRKHVSIKFTLQDLRAHLKPMFLILGTTLVTSVYLLLDTIILGFIKGEAAVGIYTTAVRIVKIPFAIIIAISTVIIPQISQAFHTNDKERIQSLLHKSYSLIFVLALPITAGLYISSGFLVHLFAGPKFTDAILPLQILGPVMLLVGFNNILGYQILTPFGNEKKLLYAVMAGMVFSLFLNIFLISRYSFTGAAVTNVLTECLVTALCFVFARKLIAVPFDGKLFIQGSFASISFFPIAYLVRSIGMDYILTEIVVIFSCMLFYSIFTWTFVKNIYVLDAKRTILNKLGITSFILT